MAHPRSRGENAAVRDELVTVAGSSPLTRGKPARCVLRGASRRLIPAHAGKTKTSGARSTKKAAHPRSRGENIDRHIPGLLGWGSSPLTRGKRPVVAGSSQPGGLIPAHAGKTVRGETRPCRARAHPRSRGENLSRSLRRSRPRGSSPLTRGKLARRGCRSLRAGLIPAHAGKT